jgi:hypothetical protein
MIELFLFILAILFVLYVAFASCYLLVGKKYKKLTNNNSFFPTRFFKYRRYTGEALWLSVLWITVYGWYNYDKIEFFVRRLLC